MLLWIFSFAIGATGKAEIIFSSFRSPLEVYLTMTTTTSEKPRMWKGSINQQKTEIIIVGCSNCEQQFSRMCVHILSIQVLNIQNILIQILKNGNLENKSFLNLVPWKVLFFSTLFPRRCVVPANQIRTGNFSRFFLLVSAKCISEQTVGGQLECHLRIIWLSQRKYLSDNRFIKSLTRSKV